MRHGDDAVTCLRAATARARFDSTMDTYGKWLPLGNKAAVNQLDEKVVAKKTTGTPGVTEVPVNNGGPSRTRTVDPLIKSPPAAA